jgi:putative SOS response-associated peptidase YedK
MCGQFAVLSNLKQIKDYYNFLIESGNIIENDFFDDIIASNLNQKRIKPFDYFPIITKKNNVIITINARWGLVPFWAKDEKIASKTINARIETITEKPSFKYAYEKRRCLIPFTEYFEKDKNQNLHSFKNENNQIMSFAGLYEIWSENKLNTFTIITEQANEIVKPIHHRMPVILNQENALKWLCG